MHNYYVKWTVQTVIFKVQAWFVSQYNIKKDFSKFLQLWRHKIFKNPTLKSSAKAKWI